MPRRTVTIAGPLDRAIRRYQAKLVEERNEDITYTEALNQILLLAFVQASQHYTEGDWLRDAADKITHEELGEILDAFASRSLILDDVIAMLPTIRDEADAES